MKKACVTVDNCADCPHVCEDFETSAYQCTILDLKVVIADTIDEDCPLEDE
jgi:hypothetical protein